MARKEIRLSPKYGVNPTIPVCYFCGEHKNEILLLGRISGPINSDREAPRSMVFDKTPCDNCAALMARGIMLISVRDGEPESENPYRTGRMAVVTEDAISRIMPAELAASFLKSRVGFVEDLVWDSLGLPSENIDNR